MSITTSRWSRRFVLVGAFSLCCWQIAALVGAPRRTLVTLALFGFVFHVAFGKAYALVPAYFDADLAVERAPALQFPLVTLGTVCLALAPFGPLSGDWPLGGDWLLGGDVGVAAVGGLLWLGGVMVFVGTLLATVARPLLGGETGTGDHNADRRPVDRLANAFVPAVLGYLLVGSYETAALEVDALPTLVGVPAAATHLLAAGAATLLVFALGFRLLPRFFGGRPTRRSAAVVLSAGTAGPALVAAGFVDGRFLAAGAALQALAIVAFAVVVGRIAAVAERRRIGLYGVLAGVTFGVVGVGLGVHFATGGLTPALVETHRRLNLLGFLGLVIVGVSFQFYPPSVGTFPRSSDGLAAAAIAAIAAGLVVETVVAVTATGSPFWTVVGRWLALVGVAGYAYLLVSAFVARSNRTEKR